MINMALFFGALMIDCGVGDFRINMFDTPQSMELMCLDRMVFSCDLALDTEFDTFVIYDRDINVITGVCATTVKSVIFKDGFE